jgi:deoxyribose-phosphate aldolase
MNRLELARLLDHSVLAPEATARDIDEGAQVVRTWSIGFYCVQPACVQRAATQLRGVDARVVTVAGFPHGCDRSEVKARAAALAIDDGAAEVDMVINIGALRSGEPGTVAADIAAIVAACGPVPVKVIVEAAALSPEQTRLACELARDAGARFVKTSTGFHATGGARVDDVRLMRATVGNALGVKASGGIRTLSQAVAMLDAGASRIGTSASARILAELPA